MVEAGGCKICDDKFFWRAVAQFSVVDSVVQRGLLAGTVAVALLLAARETQLAAARREKAPIFLPRTLL